MPEAPECRVIVNQLEKTVTERKLLGVKILSGRYLKSEISGLCDMSFPTWIDAVKSKGKFIYFVLSDSKCIFNTLGMTGTWAYDLEEKDYKHGRVRFILDEGFLTFIDTRNFGTVKFSTHDALKSKLENLGWAPLDDRAPVGKIIRKAHKNPERYITEVLMDQKIFSGVGNYIKAESLYRAKITPHRKVKDISEAEWVILCSAIENVVSESYMSKGTTIRDYRDSDGKAGTYQIFLQVYGKKLDPLGNPVEKIKTPDGRMTHWVPAVQK